MLEKVLEQGETLLGFSEGEPNGPPVLFLHGVGRAGKDFSPLFSSLASEHQLFTLDARGHGRSSRTPGFYKIRDHETDAAALLKYIGQPTIIYGHSMGALNAMVIAATRPDLVRGIILEDPPGVNFLKTLVGKPYHFMFQAMAKFAGSDLSVATLANQLGQVTLPTGDGRGEIQLGQIRDSVSLRLSARFLKDVDPAVYYPLLECDWLEGLDFQSLIKRISCPALLLIGEEKAGGMLPASEAETLAAHIPDCLPVRFPGVGHLIHWTATQSCLAAVHSFLNAIP